MTITKSVVPVHKIKKLIDLNGDKTNFDLSFTVKSTDKSPFEAIVVSQAQLDDGEPLPYKNVSQGLISGNIVSDKNVYQNYFLLLKSENEVECQIEIDIKDIPPKINLDQSKQVQVSRESQQDMANVKKMSNSKNNPPKSNLTKILLIICGIIGVGLVLYFFYKKPSVVQIKSLEDTSSLLNKSEEPYVPINIVEPIILEPEPSSSNVYNNSILDSGDSDINLRIDNKLFTRLNNIKIW
jgi:hypothetical protein